MKQHPPGAAVRTVFFPLHHADIFLYVFWRRIKIARVSASRHIWRGAKSLAQHARVWHGSGSERQRQRCSQRRARRWRSAALCCARKRRVPRAFLRRWLRGARQNNKPARSIAYQQRQIFSKTAWRGNNVASARTRPRIVRGVRRR